MSYRGLLFFLFLLFLCSLFPASSYADPLDTWYLRPPPQGDNLSAITYGNGTFVAVGDSGTIITSIDGSRWTSSSSGISHNLYAVTYGKNQFVIVGDSGLTFTSSNGITWTSESAGTINRPYSLTYGNNLFVAVGDAGSILTSPDDITWTNRYSGTASTLYSVAYGNNLFVVVGDSGTILTSPDGIIWTSRSSGINDALLGIAYGKDVFVATNGYTMLTSSDGITWVRTFPGQFGGEGLFSLGVTYGNNSFVAVTAGSAWMLPFYQIVTSSDGIVWTSRTDGVGSLYGVTYGNGTVVTVGSNGTIMQSSSFCAATLDPDLSIHVPYLSFAANYFWADFSYVPDTLNFNLVNYGSVTDATVFDGCTPATLSYTLLLHIPNLMFGESSYWLDLQFINQGTTFSYSNMGINN